MKALVLRGGKISLSDIPKPQISESDAIVKVKTAGICKTDLELVKGYMGFEGVLGHEFVGYVHETADGLDTGKRVCGEINYGCNECSFCLRGMQRHCPNRTVMGILNQDGAFAEYLAVPVHNLRFVPDEIEDHQAAFVEPLAAAFEIMEQIQIEPNHKVAVIGDGRLGLLICQALKLTGCDLTLIGRHERKLSLGRSWGVQAVRVSDSGEITGTHFDVVVEASGSVSGFATAMDLVRPRGTIVLKSTYAGNLELNAAAIVINEISVVGSRCGQFEPAIRALRLGLVDVSDLVDAIYRFDDVLTAFQRAGEPGTLKVLIDFP